MTLAEPPPLPAPDPAERGPTAGGAETVDEIVRGSLPDRANPVFVKEVRHAQRGRCSRSPSSSRSSSRCSARRLRRSRSWTATVRQPGVDFFSAIYVLLSIAVLVVVPFQAFVSMGSEWDGDSTRCCCSPTCGHCRSCRARSSPLRFRGDVRARVPAVHRDGVPIARRRLRCAGSSPRSDRARLCSVCLLAP